MIIEHEFEIDELAERFFATVWVEAEVEPGEPEIRYYPNSELGCPGSPPTAYVLDAKVTSLSGANWDKSRSELERGWPEMLELLDRMALDYCQNLPQEALFEVLTTLWGTV